MGKIRLKGGEKHGPYVPLSPGLYSRWEATIPSTNYVSISGTGISEIEHNSGNSLKRLN